MLLESSPDLLLLLLLVQKKLLMLLMLMLLMLLMLMLMLVLVLRVEEMSGPGGGQQVAPPWRAHEGSKDTTSNGILEEGCRQGFTPFNGSVSAM